MIYIDYLEKDKTVTKLHYAELFSDLKRPHLMLYHNDNVELSYELSYEMLPHLSYSPDLEPYDFILFPNLKKSLAR